MSILNEDGEKAFEKTTGWLGGTFVRILAACFALALIQGILKAVLP